MERLESQSCHRPLEEVDSERAREFLSIGSLVELEKQHDLPWLCCGQQTWSPEVEEEEPWIAEKSPIVLRLLPPRARIKHR